MKLEKDEFAIAVPCWPPALSVRNALLDKQHIELCELLRSLADKCSPDVGGFVDALQDVIKLAELHCIAEEKELEVNGFPWLEQHREEHWAGLDRLHQMCDLVTRGEMGRREAVIATVGWFDTHLADMDLAAIDFMQRSRAGIPVESAGLAGSGCGREHGRTTASVSALGSPGTES